MYYLLFHPAPCVHMFTFCFDLFIKHVFLVFLLCLTGLSIPLYVKLIKYCFNSTVTITWIKWLKYQCPSGTKTSLLWDHTSVQDSAEVKEFITKAEVGGLFMLWLVAGGLTSVIQLWYNMVNSPIKKWLNYQYQNWPIHELCCQRLALDLLEDTDAGWN